MFNPLWIQDTGLRIEDTGYIIHQCTATDVADYFTPYKVKVWIYRARLDCAVLSAPAYLPLRVLLAVRELPASLHDSIHSGEQLRPAAHTPIIPLLKQTWHPSCFLAVDPFPPDVPSWPPLFFVSAARSNLESCRRGVFQAAHKRPEGVPESRYGM
jgi:hypothetical protein